MTRFGMMQLLLLAVAVPSWGAATSTFTPTETVVVTATVSPTVNVGVTATATVSPTGSPTGSPTASPTATVSASPTPSPADSPTPVPSTTVTPGLTGTASPTPVASPLQPANQDASYVYPDPVPYGTDAWAVITLDGPGSVDLRLYNSAGEAAAEASEHLGAGGRQRCALPTASFAPGVYLYSAQITYDDGHQARLPLGHFVVGRR